MPQNAVQSVLDLIKLDEGYRQFPYRCTANKLTIGYGTNLEDRGISRTEAEYLLQNDLDAIESHLAQEAYWLGLDEVRKAACCSLMYNLGKAGYSQFKRFKAALTVRDYQKAADELVASKWYTQVGIRGPRLAGTIRSGEWPQD